MGYKKSCWFLLDYHFIYPQLNIEYNSYLPTGNKQKS